MNHTPNVPVYRHELKYHLNPAFMNCDYLNLTQYDEPLVRELGIKMQTHLLRPKSAVRYRREAFIYGPGNVRVTLDTKLLSCRYPFFKQYLHGKQAILCCTSRK